MTHLQKVLVYNSLADYHEATKVKQAFMVGHVRRQLTKHFYGMEHIGMGLNEDDVQAAKVFLRIVNKQS
jgi:hypothetical protein